MKTIKLTIFSDTHNKHKHITGDLPGGDLLICAGDISSMGYEHEIREFAKWYNGLNNYHHKVFIAGNHDWGFQNNVEKVKEIVGLYDTITYLQDDWVNVGDGDPHDNNTQTVKIWGSPWQPEFYNWAFNLPRNGEELKAVWDMIPEDIDILITHGPAWGFLDDVEGNRNVHLGCELLAERIKQIKPKIHICGHIHSGHGHHYDGHTHYFNAAVLNERYLYSHLPWQIDWNPITNEIDFL
jgi:Icc-related predicted phosphoesterase